MTGWPSWLAMRSRSEVPDAETVAVFFGSDGEFGELVRRQIRALSDTP